MVMGHGRSWSLVHWIFLRWRVDESGFKHRFRRDAYATQMRRGIKVVLDPTQVLRARRQLGRDVGATQIGV